MVEAFHDSVDKYDRVERIRDNINNQQIGLESFAERVDSRHGPGRR